MARAAEKCYTEESLQEVFDTVEEKAEFRDKRGKRHSLAVVIMLYLLGQILGYMSYRSIQRNFSAKENRTKIEERLPIPHGIPSYTTFSRVMSHIPNDILLVEICDWIWQQLPEDADQQLHFGIDGKALRAVISKAVEGINLYMINIYGVGLIEQMCREAKIIPFSGVPRISNLAGYKAFY